ncbi:hypothetical protein [Streptococcus sciuri]|uniref:Uncharacterized protein n=1 Tax=Streptococcus sciuri TaxID=2973939 RepID=A0ABT2F815_9STRE|nr:hypothetical protein [Streptococcus sciuri]MCS4488635.1 hypothetical protein [Streptococcus sciuri]
MSLKEVLIIGCKDIEKLTDKSISTIKKWHLKIEELSGYEFPKETHRVSRRSVQTYFVFTKEEVAKFVELSKEIDKTKDLESSVKKVWGDLNAQFERHLGQEISKLRLAFMNYKKAANKELKRFKQNNISLSLNITTLEKTL